jgi:hypothetical protein
MLGMSKEDFLALHSMIKHKMHNSKRRRSHNALAIFLMKMQLNLSHRVLATLFGQGLNKQRVSYIFHFVRGLLMEEFVPKHLGFQSISREDYIRNHSTPLANLLLGAGDRQAIFVVDGTYLYIQKSRNYNIQRRTYSMHKFRNLVNGKFVTYA